VKMILDKRNVEGLSFGAVPVIKDGKLVGTTPNEKNRHFVVFDAHPSAPTGFGIRVSQRVKTYVLQVRQGSAVKTVSVGRHPDLLIGKEARADRNARLIAAELSARLRRGEDVNATRREARHAATQTQETLRGLFNEFLKGYQANAKRPARSNTIKAVEAAMARLGDKLLDKAADEVSWMDLKAFFEHKAGVLKHLTAAEQTIRWVSAVYNKADDQRTLAALAAGVEPSPLRNPATLFSKTGALRVNAELQRDYDAKGVRKPLSASADDFKKWLDYVIAARARTSARTGADYLLVTVILGCRKSETAGLMWADRLPPEAGEGPNLIDLGSKLMVLSTTKNRHTHRLPLPPFVCQILTERRKLSNGSPYVFPAASRSRLRQTGHYSDPRAFMDSVKTATGVDFAMHDLRRTFGNVVNNMSIPSLLTQQLLNHKAAGSTATYTQQSIEQLRGHMERIEAQMLNYATCSPMGKTAEGQP
jgi:integrase